MYKFLSFLLLLTGLVTVVTAVINVQSNGSNNQVGKSYIVSTIRRNFAQAVKFCSENSMAMLSLATSEEYSWIVEHLMVPEPINKSTYWYWVAGVAWQNFESDTQSLYVQYSANETKIATVSKTKPDGYTICQSVPTTIELLNIINVVRHEMQSQHETSKNILEGLAEQVNEIKQNSRDIFDAIGELNMRFMDTVENVTDRASAPTESSVTDIDSVSEGITLATNDRMAVFDEKLMSMAETVNRLADIVTNLKFTVNVKYDGNV